METENNDTLFRKKILNLLSREEQLLFNERYSKNPDFQKEFHAYKEMMEAVIVAENTDLKKRLENLGTSKKKTFRSWLPIAASLALLIGISAFLYLNGKEDAYDTYFDTYPNVLLPTTRGNQGNDDIIEKAFFNYDKAQFKEANEAFKVYLESHKDQKISFYRAMTLMHLNELKEAKEILGLIINEDKDFEYAGEIRWYLALLYLKENNNVRAIELLETNKDEEIDFKVEETDELLLYLVNPYEPGLSSGLFFCTQRIPNLKRGTKTLQ